MTSSLRYAAVGTGVVALVVLVFLPFLDPVGRRSIVVAALVALPIQVGSFALMERHRDRVKSFLVAWVGGTVLRMCVIGVVAVVAIRAQAEGLAPLLLALASFFFGLLLLEPVYFRAGERRLADR
jgi:quinol-cytochrome oxidoreductase complex cytochrome b subunit